MTFVAWVGGCDRQDPGSSCCTSSSSSPGNVSSFFFFLMREEGGNGVGGGDGEYKREADEDFLSKTIETASKIEEEIHDHQSWKISER